MSNPDAVRFGFSLTAINWESFSRKAMLDQTEVCVALPVLYTITQIFGMAAQGAAAYCMFKYKNLRHHILIFSNHTAHVHDNDIFSSAVLSMTFPAVLSIYLTFEYFILLFWPENVYPKRWNQVRKWIMLLTTAAMGATIILSTIVVTSHTGFITGVDSESAKQLTDLYFRPPLNYSTWPQNIAWITLTWICFVFNLACLPLMLITLNSEHRQDIKVTKKGIENPSV
ncbi:hypothetical protein CVT24_004176 [Panaeolus cyanescens]|uniref:Uncharacterized protein n=1 Tax=Panaeolus cyanescens TaxID=181874 RepID=A0A409W7Z4_9AGAR|nr:hypothetical protein CVT24_004176 [Panaeolus cyanescens]